MVPKFCKHCGKELIQSDEFKYHEITGVKMYGLICPERVKDYEKYQVEWEKHLEEEKERQRAYENRSWFKKTFGGDYYFRLGDLSPCFITEHSYYPPK